MRVVGYGRAAASERSVLEQQEALFRAGAEKVFLDDGVSGATAPASRPGLAALLEYASPGDRILATTLDRIGRSAVHVLAFVQLLTARGIALQTLHDGIDTGGEDSKGILATMTAFATMERGILREKTTAGLEARSAKGLPIGRPKALNLEQRELVATLRAEGRSTSAIARLFGVSKSTIGRIAPAAAPPD